MIPNRRTGEAFKRFNVGLHFIFSLAGHDAEAPLRLAGCSCRGDLTDGVETGILRVFAAPGGGEQSTDETGRSENRAPAAVHAVQFGGAGRVSATAGTEWDRGMRGMTEDEV